MYLLYLAPSSGKSGAASSSGQIKRIKMDLEANDCGTEEISVGQLREKISNVLVSQHQQEAGSQFKIIYCGRILKDDDKRLKSLGISSRSSIQVIPSPSVGEDSDIRVAPVSTTDEEVQQFMLAFGMAVRNPNFNQMATKAAKNLEDLCASVPGLDKDPVACAFLSKPELMLNLLHPDTFKYVAEKHPGLIEVANNLAALILESKPGSSGSAEKKSGDGGGSSSSSNPFAYHLDEMSDEEYDEEEDEPMDTDAAAGAAGGGRGYQPISAEQLRAALNAATFGGGGGGGLGGANSGSSAGRGLYSGGSGMGGQASTSTSTLTSPAITQDQLAAALAAATGGGAAGPSSSSSMTPGSAVPPASNPFSFLSAPPTQGSGGAGPSSGGTSVRNWESELAKMREMGISDETLAKKALTLMGGDIQAAIELIFSGWDGMDDSTN